MNDLARRAAIFLTAQQGRPSATVTFNLPSLSRLSCPSTTSPAAVSLADQESGAKGTDFGIGLTAQATLARPG